MTPAPCYRLRDCDLFASGKYRGQDWTPAQLRQIAANAQRLGPEGLNLHVAPGVGKPSVPTGGVGHDENEAGLAWLQRTDLPAAGQVYPQTVRVVPDPKHPGHLILRGDLVNVPPETAAKIVNREYTRGSAELYQEFLDDFENRYGPAMRRFVILGGEVPQVKRLRPLPMPEPMAAPIVFAELKGPTRFAERPAFLSFAEGAVMDRAALIKVIQAACPGMSQATIETNTDDALKEWVANLPKPQPQPTNPTGTAGMDRDQMIAELTAAGQDPAALAAMDDASLKAAYDALKAGGAPANPDAAGDVATMGDAATMSREEIIAELVAAGQDAASLETMSDDDLRKMYADLGLGATAETPAAAAPAVSPMSERDRRKVREAVAFSEQAVKQLRAQLHANKVQRVNAFCEQMVAAGKLLPAHVGDYKSLLLSLDDTKPVHKFSDGGRQVSGSALGRKMAEIKARAAIVRFGEKVPGGGSADQTTHAAAVRKAEAHADAIPEATWKLTSFKSRGGFVSAFSERAAKTDPAAALREFDIK